MRILALKTEQKKKKKERAVVPHFYIDTYPRVKSDKSLDNKEQR